MCDDGGREINAETQRDTERRGEDFFDRMNRIKAGWNGSQHTKEKHRVFNPSAALAVVAA